MAPCTRPRNNCSAWDAPLKQVVTHPRKDSATSSQTDISVTPPGASTASHAYKPSKEEDLIFSLKTQLTLQTELCREFETDLCARDVLVDMLVRKLMDVEGEVAKKRSMLKHWKKKVAELEMACRYLEEGMEESRQESMRRSIIDEASSEALEMLHRRIAGLERENESSKMREEMLREEVGTLEALLRKKSDKMTLKDTLWSRDKTECELQAGIQGEIEEMGKLHGGLTENEEHDDGEGSAE
ncbi:hypothetical protein B0H13DRAFT_2336036 [Mycena leptocephala]|nr:hypothetical protein B0H13DRAFT_2336036 [Mycena leptocephala]